MERRFVAQDPTKNSIKRLRPIAYINMVPLIDVMLVILVVFLLLAGMVNYQQLTVKLPQAQLKGHSQQSQALVIYIDKHGNYFKLLANKHLIAISPQLLSHNAEAVSVMANPNTPYQKVVTLLALLQRQHIKNINLITETHRQQ